MTKKERFSMPLIQISIQQESKNIKEKKHFFSTDLEIIKSENINFLPTKDKKLKSILLANLIFCIKYNKDLYVYRKKIKVQDQYGFTYEQFINCLDWLVSEKYVTQEIGQFFGESSKFNSITKIIPTDKLKELLKSENINEAYFWNIKKNKRTVHFDLTDKELKSYLKTNEADRVSLKVIRDKLLILNTLLSSTNLYLSSRIGSNNEISSIDIDELSDSILPQKLGNWKIIFEKNIHEHGRLYHPFQNYRSIDRLNWKINNEEVVELDFSATHPQIIYHQLGLVMPSNVYHVDGYTRDEAKLAMMMMINCKSRIGALAAIKNEDPSIQDPNSLMKQLEQNNKQILHKLYQGNYGLMNMDGKIALDICYELAKKNIFCYPIHDSFIVAKSNQKELENQMVFSWQKINKTNYIPKYDELTKEKAKAKCQRNINKNLEQKQKEQISQEEPNKPIQDQNYIQINTLNNGKTNMEYLSGQPIVHTDPMILMTCQDSEIDIETPTMPLEASETIPATQLPTNNSNASTMPSSVIKTTIPIHIQTNTDKSIKEVIKDISIDQLYNNFNPNEDPKEDYDYWS